MKIEDGRWRRKDDEFESQISELKEFYKKSKFKTKKKKKIKKGSNMPEIDCTEF
jgi:hypothetical protein